MTGIQLLLIAGVILIALYYIFRLRSALFDLLILVLGASAAVFFILFPDYTNVLAHRLGVGRGADLLFYLCILFFLFVVMKLFGRIRRLEQKLTDLVRDEAKENALRK